MSWFYDHLARLIYAESIGWKPGDVKELQSYVDSHRKSHELEGYAGEYILPNWNLYMRESRLYADIEAGEDGNLSWSDPVESTSHSFTDLPVSIQLVNAMEMAGLFTAQGLKATSEIWGKVDFVDSQGFEESSFLTKKLLDRLIEEGLPNESATAKHAHALVNLWQLPMYNLDFKMIEVPMDELEAEREIELANLGGYAQDEFDAPDFGYW